MTPRSHNFRPALAALTLTAPALWATACGADGNEAPHVDDTASIDLRVVVPGPDAAQDLYRLEDRAQHAGTVAADGVIAVTTAAVTLRSPDGSIDTCAMSVNLPTARRFHVDAEATGLADTAAPDTDRILVARSHADALEVAAGDGIEVATSDGTLDRMVRAVVPDTSLAGYCGAIIAPADLPETSDGELLVSLRDPDDEAAREQTAGALDGLAADIGRPDLRATDVTDVADRFGQDADR